MKKYIILFLILLLTGCAKFDDSVYKKRENLINNIISKEDNKIVIKNNKNDKYYVYNIVNNYSYVSYLYIFHHDEKSYDKYVKAKEDINYYELKKFDDAYVTKIKYMEASIKENEDIKKSILDKYSNKRKYTIIY